MEPERSARESLGWLRASLTAGDVQALPRDDVEALRPFGTRVFLEAGDVLFRQGDRPSLTYIIESGEAELVYETQFERLIIELLGPGAAIGYLAVVLDTSYAYTAVASTELAAIAFDTATVQTLVELRPEVCFRWLRLVAQRLERAQRRLVEFAGKTAFERVVHFLINESEERGTLELIVTQQRLADALALSRQTVSRVLGELEAQQLVDRRRGQLRVTDLESLRAHTPR